MTCAFSASVAICTPFHSPSSSDQPVTQWTSAQNELKNLQVSIENLNKQPERMPLALEAYFRMQSIEATLGSVFEGMRRYQNPAIADLLQSVVNENSTNRDRLKQYMTKALREAKTHTSWIAINEDYESRVMSFLESLYKSRKFRADFERFQKKIAYFGASSSLSQLVLKATSPGVPVW